MKTRYSFRPGMPDPARISFDAENFPGTGSKRTSSEINYLYGNPLPCSFGSETSGKVN